MCQLRLVCTAHMWWHNCTGISSLTWVLNNILEVCTLSSVYLQIIISRLYLLDPDAYSQCLSKKQNTHSQTIKNAILLILRHLELK